MNDREWVYGRLIASGVADVEGMTSEKILQGESIGPWLKDQLPRPPFVVWRMGNTSRDNRMHRGREQYFTVYCHDDAKPGDYQRIDVMVNLVVQSMDQVQGAGKIIQAQWLETSADFDDREMGTIMRYVRFQLVKSTITGY